MSCASVEGVESAREQWKQQICAIHVFSPLRCGTKLSNLAAGLHEQSIENKNYSQDYRAYDNRPNNLDQNYIITKSTLIATRSEKSKRCKTITAIILYIKQY